MLMTALRLFNVAQMSAKAAHSELRFITDSLASTNGNLLTSAIKTSKAMHSFARSAAV